MIKPHIFILPLTLFLCFISFSNNVNAQDKVYALNCVKTLSSPEYHGRGFVKKGDKKAAKFIQNELKKWGVKPFNKTYQQKFPIDINTLHKAEFSLDKKNVVLGEDYLIHAASSSLKGDYKLYYPAKFSIEKYSKEDHKNELFVLDTFNYKSTELIENYHNIIGSGVFKNAAGVVEVKNKKLMQTQRTYEFGFPLIQIKKEAWDSTAQSAQVNIKSKLIKAYQTQNVIGYIEGEVDSFMVYGAHYDHLGRIAKDVYFPGANDNASGVSTVLSLAKYYHDHNIKPKYSIAFILFSAEEAGLLGSLYYTEHPSFPLSKIKFMFNLDMVGTGIKGLSIVNGKENMKASELIESINQEHEYFEKIFIGKRSANSDHHFFDKAGVPAVFFFTRGGPRFYHDIFDRSATLELNKLEEIIKLLIQFSNTYE